MTAEVRFHRVLTVLLTAALLATLTVALTGGNRAEAVEGPVEVVYVATGQNFPDALAGANLAATVGAPMLTVNPDLPIPDPTTTALEALDPNQIIILGGPVAVSDAVKGALGDYTRSGAVTRIEGGDRHDTAAQIADALPSKVHDADQLDSLDSTDFLRATSAHSYWVYPGGSGRATVPTDDRTVVDIGDVELTTPGPGMLLIRGGHYILNRQTDNSVSASIRLLVNGDVVEGNLKPAHAHDYGNRGNHQAGSSFEVAVSVEAGTQKLYWDLFAIRSGDGVDVDYRVDPLLVTFVPAALIQAGP